MLDAAASSFTWLLKYKGLRRSPELWSEPKEIVSKTIDNALFFDVGQSDEQVASDSKYYSKFFAYPHGFDVFDDWKAYIIEGDTGAICVETF